MNIEQILPFIAVPVMLMLISAQLDKEHTYLKILLLFFSFWGIFLIGAYMADQASTTINQTFYKYCISIVSTFVLYVMVYFVYTMFKYFETIPKIKGWKTKRGW